MALLIVPGAMSGRVCDATGARHTGWRSHWGSKCAKPVSESLYVPSKHWALHVDQKLPSAYTRRRVLARSWVGADAASSPVTHRLQCATWKNRTNKDV